MNDAATDQQTEGRCLCGAVVVRVTGPMADIWACHCENCTRWSGSVQMGIDIPRERVTVSGPVKVHQSTHIAQRAWCDTCGSALWLENTGAHDTGMLELAPGLFPNAGGGRLVSIAYADRAPDGYALAGNVRRVSKADYEATHAHVDGGRDDRD